MKLLVVTQKVDKDDENLGAFYYWFEKMGKKCERLVIIASSAGGSAKIPNAEIAFFGGKNRFRFFRWLEFAKLFWRHYRRSDAVFFHQIPEFVLAAAPFLIFSRRVSGLWYAHKAVTLKLKAAERLVDWVFTSSAEGFRLPSKKAVYCGQAINTDFFSPSGRASGAGRILKIITVGRVSPIKNYENIIRACALLKAKGFERQWVLSIVGGPLVKRRDEEYFSRLKKLAAEAGLENRVHFEGSRPYGEIPELLNGNDIFVNLSGTGSLDKAVLEAMSCGLTTLTSNESFRNILPSPYFLESSAPEFLAERIISLAGEARPNAVLRNIVAEKHGLEKTVAKILSALESFL